MLYVAEIPVAAGDLTEEMTRMRTWLDHQRLVPSSFRLAPAGGERKLRVAFKEADEAAAFASEFNGSLRSRPAADVLIG